MNSGVLILTGPTASGKTELAISLARKFGAEIVSADSRQIYRGMPIGTAAPTPEQLREVPHHLIGFLDPSQRYSAARFATDALEAIAGIHSGGKRAIVAGGTGFYVRALAGDVELAAEYDEKLRGRLAEEAKIHDAVFLYEWLQIRDAARGVALSPNDRYRVLRALEVALAQPASKLRTKPLSNLRSAGLTFAKAYLQVDQAMLEERIEKRAQRMLDRGLLDEAQRIGPHAVAADAVGYPQALAYLGGWSTFDELRAVLVRATRRYVKRQQTWFRSEPGIHRIAPGDAEAFAREMLGWV